MQSPFTCAFSDFLDCDLTVLRQEMQKESAKSSALWQQLQDLQQQLAERDSATEKLQTELSNLRKANEVSLPFVNN